MNQNCFCYSGSKESFSHKKNNLFKLNNFLDPKWFFFVIFFWFHFVTLFGCFLHFLICWKQILLNFKRKHHFKLNVKTSYFGNIRMNHFDFLIFFVPNDFWYLTQIHKNLFDIFCVWINCYPKDKNKCQPLC